MYLGLFIIGAKPAYLLCSVASLPWGLVWLFKIMDLVGKGSRMVGGVERGDSQVLP